MLNNTREGDASCHKVDVQQDESQRSRTGGAGGGGKPPADEELQFNLDEQEEGRTHSGLGGSRSEKPQLRLEQDKTSRFYPVPLKRPLMKDGKVVLFVCLSVHSKVSMSSAHPSC